MLPESVSFKEIADWENLTLADYETISKLYRYKFHMGPAICCEHKKGPWLRDLNEGVKDALRDIYDSILKIHNKYKIKCTGMIRIREISNNSICVDLLTEEMINKIIAATGNTYIEAPVKRTRKKK